MELRQIVEIHSHWREKFNGRVGVIQSKYGEDVYCVRFGSQIEFFPATCVKAVLYG